MNRKDTKHITVRVMHPENRIVALLNDNVFESGYISHRIEDVDVWSLLLIESDDSRFGHLVKMTVEDVFKQMKGSLSDQESIENFLIATNDRILSIRSKSKIYDDIRAKVSGICIRTNNGHIDGLAFGKAFAMREENRAIYFEESKTDPVILGETRLTDITYISISAKKGDLIALGTCRFSKEAQMRPLMESRKTLNSIMPTSPCAVAVFKL